MSDPVNAGRGGPDIPGIGLLQPPSSILLRHHGEQREVLSAVSFTTGQSYDQQADCYCTAKGWLIIRTEGCSFVFTIAIGMDDN